MAKMKPRAKPKAKPKAKPTSKQQNKAAHAILRYIDKDLQRNIGGSAALVIAHLTPHRTTIPGTTVDEALYQLRLIFRQITELQHALRSARSLFRGHGDPSIWLHRGRPQLWRLL